MLRKQPGFEPFADNLKYEIIKLDNGKFAVVTNIDFPLGNKRRNAVDPSLGQVTQSSLLVSFLEAAADTQIAAFYGSDFRTSEASSEIIRIRFKELLRRTDISADQINQFNEIVLNNYPTIREVIDSGERSFDEFEALLDRSDRFRRSLDKLSPDTNLVREYFAEVSREGWISSLPAKLARYVVGLGAGAAGSFATGAAASAADTFLLDKLKGWRPNHFVDKRVKPFLTV
jgi:hypothetical protein